MSVFVLKIIAIITMLFDHTSFLIYGSSFSWMRYIGRISFPIFAFLIAEGYSHTKDEKKYFLRLLIFSFISQYPFDLFLSPWIDYVYLNVGFTLSLGLLSIIVYEKLKEKINKANVDRIEGAIYKVSSFLIVFIICALATAINCDYSFYGVLLVFFFHIFRNKKILLSLSTIVLIIITFFPYIFSNLLNLTDIIKLVFYLIPIVLVNFYNGKKGPSFKILFYLIYPVHLLIIGILEVFLLK